MTFFLPCCFYILTFLVSSCWQTSRMKAEEKLGVLSAAGSELSHSTLVTLVRCIHSRLFTMRARTLCVVAVTVYLCANCPALNILR